MSKEIDKLTFWTVNLLIQFEESYVSSKVYCEAEGTANSDNAIAEWRDLKGILNLKERGMARRPNYVQLPRYVPKYGHED